MIKMEAYGILILTNSITYKREFINSRAYKQNITYIPNLIFQGRYRTNH